MDKYIKLETVTSLIDNTLEQLKNISGDISPIIYSNNVPQAHWLPDPIDELFVDWECSNCHKYALINPETHGPFRSAYCPHCGALMDKDSKNVLAAFDDVVLVAFYDNDNNEWIETATHSLFFPTHWMPLPTPPKK